MKKARKKMPEIGFKNLFYNTSGNIKFISAKILERQK
jgi:hypothetical protein